MISEQSELYIKLDRLTSLVEMMWLAGRAGDISNLDEYHNEANPLGFKVMRLMEQKGLDLVSEPVEDEPSYKKRDREYWKEIKESER